MNTHFFELISWQPIEDGYLAQIRLNPDHPVYNGHFPDQSVAPGVLLMNMCRQVAEEIKGEEVRISSARSIKFVKVVDPRKVQEMQLSLKFVEGDDSMRFQCIARSGEDIYFKIIANI